MREATVSVTWLPGLEGPGDLSAVLSGWSLLPLARETGKGNACADKYVIDLARWTKPEAGALTLAWEGSGWLVGVRESRWDSGIFGLGMGIVDPLVAPPVDDNLDRASIAGAALINALLVHAKASGLSHLSAAVDPADSLAQLALQKVGFQLMDTIVGFHLPLSGVPEWQGAACVRPAEEADIEPLATISSECFSNRRYNVNRFNSDPVLPDSGIRKLYGEWLRNSFTGQQADRVFVYEDNGRPVGFITCKLPSRDELDLGLSLGKIPLNAVHPDYQGRGIYTQLVRAALDWFRGEEVETVEIRTQLTTGAVHRTWEKLGAYLALSYHRYHRSGW